MFNYKTWKLYSPRGGDKDPLVVDENGNSITPDSLKKNMTIPSEAPGNDLEKVLSNINGADPAYSVEGASGLIKQMNELADNPPSGGGVLVVHDSFDGSVYMMDKRWQEIYDAMLIGGAVIAQEYEPDEPMKIFSISRVYYDSENDVYSVQTVDGTYKTDDVDGYPSRENK